MDEQRVPALGPAGLAWCYRVVWAVCIGVYLTVFVSGLLGGASDLTTMVRAGGFTLASALIGRLALGIVSRATQPVRPAPLSATEDGTVGSLVDLLSSPNVSQQLDEAEAA